ncbi:unnamed protein product [Arabidopsis lyrata]|nr:unnamed protein product [Arabidopsis lyrata]
MNDLVVPADLVEEICLRLPLKSLLKFKTVSKQWRSILVSRSFAKRRRMIMNTVLNKPQILAAAGNHRTVGRLNDDEEEVEMFYLHCDAAATRPSLTCDGLVCIPLPGWINVLNPSTGELLSFPSGPDPVKTDRYDRLYSDDSWFDIFPGYWAMGFGRDEVNGSYKVVRMFFDTKQSEILDLNVGELRILPSPPPYYVEARRKSACVNGSIYWLQYIPGFKILALDLHTEEFRDVPPPPAPAQPGQLVNLEDRLAIAIANAPPNYWELKIWTMDVEDETWSKTYTIYLFSRGLDPITWRLWCRPVAVSKKGNLFFHDSQNRLFKYYPQADTVRCISSDIRVISPFSENLFPLRHLDSAPGIRTFGFHQLMAGSWISRMSRRIELQIADILFTTAVAASVIFLATKS